MDDLDDLDYVPIPRPRDLLRELHWRWQRAVYLAGLPRLPSDGDDPKTLAVVDYIRGRQRGACCDSSRRVETVAAIDGAITLARSNDRTRWEVEARILARQTDDEIATRTGLAPAVVGWYEVLFFNVRDRLNARDWIICRAIGSGFSVACQDLGQVLRAVGYLGGPAALDVMLAASAETPQQTEGVSPDPMLRDDDLLASARLLKSLLLLPLTTGLRELIQLRDHFQRVTLSRSARTVTDMITEQAADRLETAPGPMEPESGESPATVVA